MWLTIVSSLLLLYAVHYLMQIARNLVVARRTGLPYFISPFSFGILPTILYTTKWFPYIINNYLPGSVADNLNDVIWSNRWQTKDRQVKRYGGVYLTVTARAVMCNVGDAAVVGQIFGGRFPKPIWQYEAIDLYGPNVVVCEDAQWGPYRRMVGSIFNEKNNNLVWNESIRLVNGMVEHWKDSSTVDDSEGLLVKTIRDDILKFALNIFCGAGFGVRMPFKVFDKDCADVEGPYGVFQDTKTPPDGFNFTFRSVVAYMSLKINTVVLANVFIPKWVPRGLLPFLKKDFAAHRDLLGYLKRLLSLAESRDTATASNLIEEMSKDRNRNETSKEGRLSDLEIISNAHIFTIAGHETTATTLRYSLLLMALHQDVQEWVYQGIMEAIKDEPANVVDWDYATVYPKLVTPLCVMLETLRLYPPAVTIPKWTGDSMRTINYQDKYIVLDHKVNVNMNLNALHYSEKYWGTDVGVFNPLRWDAANKESFLARNADMPGLVAPGLEYRTIHRPVRGAYIPFSDGLRACIGKKFAQVEFVVALAVILRQYRLELPQGDEKSRQEAQKALDASFTIVALAMEDDLPLVFRERL